LPKSNYANGHEHEKVQKLNQSTKVKTNKDPALAGLVHQMHPNPSKNINLPKLDKLIGKNSNNYKSPVQLYQERQERNEYRKAAEIDASSLLKI